MLNKLQFQYLYNDNTDSHEVEAFTDSGQVGRLVWDDDTGEIEHLHVGDKYRRKGVATALWETAHEESSDLGVTPPAHSSIRTKAGDSWARAVGGHVPRLTDDVDGWSNQ